MEILRTFFFLPVLVLFGCSSPSVDQLNILFLGDTYFGESYGAVDLNEKGYLYSFENFISFLENSDFVVANLETPITDVGTSVLSGKKDYIHASDPVEAPKALSELGVDLVSLANNHGFDYGVDGLIQTMQVLQANRIDYIGAGDSIHTASIPFYKGFKVDDKDFNILVLAGFKYSKNYDKNFKFYAKDNKAGVYALDLDLISSQISYWKEKSPDIFIVFFPHWGANYANTDNEQILLARSIIDAGADLIVGHGAHKMQSIEKYKDKWIIYNIGNFVFNSPGRYEKLGVDPYSLIVELVVTDSLFGIKKSLNIYPIYTNNLETGYQSRFLSKGEFMEAWALLGNPGHLKKDLQTFYFKLKL